MYPAWNRWAGNRSDPGLVGFSGNSENSNHSENSSLRTREDVMRFKLLASATLMAAPFMLFGASANATEFSARLVGFEELPAIFSKGSGTLDLDLNRSARTLTFKLAFSGLSAPVTQSHIHFGKEHVAGGITVWFCGSPTNPGPTGTQACPSGGGTVSGTITSA